MTATRAAICALAAVLPFELRAPLFVLGPIGVTSVELVLYAALVIAILDAWRHRRDLHPPEPVVLAALAWLAVVAVSAMAAPAHRDEALKFAIRSGGGVLLCVATAQAIRTRAQLAAVAAALAGGAVVSTLLALLEMRSPVVRSALMAFKEQPSLVGGITRASGTFDYANTAAMYWEAVLPLAVAGGAWATAAGRTAALRVAAAAASVVIALGLTLSLSRAGVATAAGGLLVLAAIGHRVARPLRTHALVAIAGLVVFALVAPGPGGAMLLRLRSNSMTEWYNPEYQVRPASATTPAGEALTFAVTIRNAGLVTWPADGEDRVALSYFWEDERDGTRRRFSGTRIALPATVEPGDDVTVTSDVLAPETPGEYRLRWDLVLEDVTWFSALGARMGEAPVVVTEAVEPAETMPPSMDQIFLPPPHAGRRALWAMAVSLWRSHPLLGVGPDNFRRLLRSDLPGARGDDRTHANSLYFETLATLGLFGMAALAGLAAAMAWRVRAGWVADRSAASRVLVAGVAVAAGSFFVHGLLDYFLIFTPTYGLFWLLVGLIGGAMPRAAAP